MGLHGPLSLSYIGRKIEVIKIGGQVCSLNQYKRQREHKILYGVIAKARGGILKYNNRWERKTQDKGWAPAWAHKKGGGNLDLQIVHTEPNNCTTEIFTVQNGLTALSKPGIVEMAFMVPDVLEVYDP